MRGGECRRNFGVGESGVSVGISFFPAHNNHSVRDSDLPSVPTIAPWAAAKRGDRYAAGEVRTRLMALREIFVPNPTPHPHNPRHDSLIISAY